MYTTHPIYLFTSYMYNERRCMYCTVKSVIDGKLQLMHVAKQEYKCIKKLNGKKLVGMIA